MRNKAKLTFFTDGDLLNGKFGGLFFFFAVYLILNNMECCKYNIQLNKNFILDSGNL